MEGCVLIRELVDLVLIKRSLALYIQSVIIRLIHRCHFVESAELFKFTKEKTLEFFVCKYLKKRLLNIYKSDLGRSYF